MTKFGTFRDNLPTATVGYASGDEISHTIATFEDADGNAVDVSGWTFEMSVRDDETEIVSLDDSAFSVGGSSNEELTMTVSASDSTDLDQATSRKFEGVLKATNTGSNNPDPFYVLEVIFLPQNFVDEE